MKSWPCYDAIEHFEDGPPEPAPTTEGMPGSDDVGRYRHWLGSAVLRPGEPLRPVFADGIKRRCIRVDGSAIHVRAEDGWDLWCDLWRNIYAHKETYGDQPHYCKAARWLADGGFMGAAMRARSAN